MTPAQFERLLTKVTEKLNADVLASNLYHKPEKFQQRVFDVLSLASRGRRIEVNPTFHPHAFPDIRANGFGVEVKSTTKDSWLSVGNSVFEGMRDPDVKHIYVVFGKMGGMPGVRWGRYEERITHVRISHAPRFVIEMDRDASLFDHLRLSYDDFAQLPPEEKMQHIRQYSRNRLKPGERLWWLEDENSQGKDIEVRLYMSLSMEEKRALRAEGTLLFPQVVGGSRVRDKYTDAAFYFLKYRNIFCPQTRDLFTAGSVAGKERGGNYLLRALQKIQGEMRRAARTLDTELFEEYWEASIEDPTARILEWLRRADGYAQGWRPSAQLFLDEQRQAQ